ncbi:MAG: hypothetical protein ACR2RL_21620 [Gammaproteobacteria bacterium]
MALMGCAPKWMPIRSPLLLYNAKVLGVEPPRSAWLEYAAERGNRLEPRAMAKVGELLGVPFEPCVIARGDYGASLDGGDFGFVAHGEPLHVEQITEVKAPVKGFDSERGRSIIAGAITPHDQVQVAHQLMVSGARVCHFGVFDESRDELRSIEVTPDSEIQAEICHAWDDFWRYVETSKPPPPGDNDILLREDDEWAAAAKQWRIAKKQLDAAVALEDAARAILRNLAGNLTTNGHGVQTTFYNEKGRVQYAKIPEIKNMGLDQYRGKGMRKMRVSEMAE